MSYGLQIRNASGVLTFDSFSAAGGVCLGLYIVPAGLQTIPFPSMVGRTGVALATGAGGSLIYTTDSAPGYLRFVFDTPGGVSAVLFAK